MPHPDMLAVRSALELTDRQSHRMVVFAALDDITGCKRPRSQWAHPTLARQLGMGPHFVNLLQNYLQYRTVRGLDQGRSLRLHGENKARLMRVEDGYPLDLLRIVASRCREAQLAELLALAMKLKVRVEGEVVVDIEKTLGRACGLAWDGLTATYQRQTTATKRETYGS
ncbi:hypothetical protein QFZ75_008056 [Streptomyces sp. V3I8]|uniref:hypothetical protein n=1 Tax=Streptomyces sp. V3I8 TaxID=3042279 RepID=UPI002785A07E|nr:hypothetical protein [Streptomyces sp. V3I8]MDQ1041554.1 hypothetical protein [Streptomyces sp. V3I8]